MCDDFWDDWDRMDDPFDEWDIEPDECLLEALDEEDGVFGENDNKGLRSEPEKLLDNVDALILGSMIFACAHQEREQKEKIKKMNKN